MIEQWSVFYRRFKFLPVTFAVGLLVLILRIEVAEQHAKQGLFITTAFVEADDKPATDAKKPDAAAAAPATPDTKTDDKSAAAPAKAADATPDPLDPTNQEMRPSGELSILKDLADRRAKIEKREAELNDREALLEAGQKKFDQEIKQLTDLRNQIKVLVDSAKANESDETKRLIDIYEKMKPKDAAGIFSSMSMDVLYPIVHNMKEAKLSPILAAMPPDKARVVTAVLTARAKVLPEDSEAIAAAAATAPPPAPAPQNTSIKAEPPAPAPAAAPTK
jgi:flagellar motility protein MotE (MotC chaperone)